MSGPDFFQTLMGKEHHAAIKSIARSLDRIAECLEFEAESRSKKEFILDLFPITNKDCKPLQLCTPEEIHELKTLPEFRRRLSTGDWGDWMDYPPEDRQFIPGLVYQARRFKHPITPAEPVFEDEDLL